MAPEQEARGLIGWFARNHVTANLIMFFIIGMGIYSLVIVKKEMMPAFQFDLITVSVPYLGAAPLEVEEGVVIKLEEAIKSIQGIRQINSVSAEGSGRVMIEVEDGYDVGELTDEIKLAVDGISTFPAETERPIYSKQLFRNGVINVQIHGDLDERSMKELAEEIRREITALPEVSFAQVTGSRPFEISIEISENTLRQYSMTLNQVAQIIRLWSIDLPGGSIRSEAGNIRLRTKGQAYTGEDFEEILLLTRPDGTAVTLGDVAVIRDGFAEVESYSFFDGERSFGIEVMSNREESEIEIAEAVTRYVEERQQLLPDGVKLTAWRDGTFYLQGHLNMMLGNMGMGALLVFVILGIFLHVKIAAWVIIGLPVAFLGAFMMLPVVGVTVNIMSLFAFILVLGIVVDDAIIIAESAYTYTEDHGYTMANIVAGAQRVAVPATFGVLTTIMAFLPMLFQTGPVSEFNKAIAYVVIFCLLFSLVESKLILPSHLAIMKSSHGAKSGLADKVDRGLKHFVSKIYAPFLVKAIEFRYATLAFFVSLLILTVGFVASGLARYVFFPEMEQPFVMANIQLQEGAPESLILDIVEQLDQSLSELNEEIRAETGFEEDVAEHLFAFIQDGSRGQLMVELNKSEDRPSNPKEIEQRWRAKVGEIAGTRELKFSSGMKMGGGPPISLALTGNNYQQVEQAADELVEHLKTYEGLYEIESSANAGPEELELLIRPEAKALGITLADLARQVREAFYGAEAQRIQRGDQEVKVMVRYPRSERVSIGNLENMWIRMPDGRELPFVAVADYKLSRGYDTIERRDGQRTVTVSSNINVSIASPQQIISQVLQDFMPGLLTRNPGVQYALAGSSFEEQASLVQMGFAFIAALFG
ncbi:MAG: efflux RND transporter permease subunit, partial [Gammaproteobacteria bacterium]|nr:efflux RND transporter permease subunit [Gammaproteobacteria bacterium]